VHATLHRPRIRRKYPVTDEDADLLAALLAYEALDVAGDVEAHASAIRDSKDAAVLACAAEGQADIIVSGGDDALGLVEYAGIPILSVRRALELIDPPGSK
jgi:putative PIN family toxin of toxin-antitoxin system